MITQGSRAAVRNFIATNENYRTLLAKVAKPTAKEARLEEEGGEIPKYYTLNSTGNIMISSTAEKDADISPDVKELFSKVMVFFGAWTAALNKKDKTLYDYDAIKSIIDGSESFIHVHLEDRNFSYSSKELTLNTAIISSVLSGFTSMGGTTALKIAQTVMGSMGNQLTFALENKQSDKKIAHLLFVCEYLMGMPMVSVQLFNTTARESESVTKSNCHQTVTQEVKMTYHMDTWMFINPDDIKKYTKDFEKSLEFEKLIDELVELIK